MVIRLALSTELSDYDITGEHRLALVGNDNAAAIAVLQTISRTVNGWGHHADDSDKCHQQRRPMSFHDLAVLRAHVQTKEVGQTFGYRQRCSAHRAGGYSGTDGSETAQDNFTRLPLMTV